MAATIRDRADRSQNGFDADQIEALQACAELVNTGRSAERDSLASLADVAEFGRRYTFRGRAAAEPDLARLRALRGRLDAVAGACEASDDETAISGLNALLAETGAIPQIVAHDGRPPHIHVSRPGAPLADRIAAHLAMAVARLVVDGEGQRLRSCASPACQDVFIDLSRNRSRRYCDSRRCGNRMHVAAYRARQQAGSPSARRRS